jgi:hypothetical protein
MILNDQLRRIAVGDLYAIGFDRIDVLGSEGIRQADKDK